MAHLLVGTYVIVADHRVGMLEMDNGNGTWSVGFDDGTDGDFPIEQISLRPDPVKQIAAAGGARLVDKSDWSQEKPAGWTRFVCFSDTHGMHEQIPKAHYVQGDVLLHAGDFTQKGDLSQVESFANWLKAYPAKHKVVIAGNHDITFHPSYYEQKWSRHHTEHCDCEAVRNALVDSGCCTYLEDDMTEVSGYRIYGTPWQPQFCDWAFQPQPGDSCKDRWQQIPQETDVLLVHGPPHGIQDGTSTGKAAGCKDLLEALRARTIPVAVFGHIHDSYGVAVDGPTLCVNATTVNHKLHAINPPVVFDLPPPIDLRKATLSMSSASNAVQH